MKSIRPPLTAIFFYDLFLQDRGGGHGPLGPHPGSATGIHDLPNGGGNPNHKDGAPTY